jgi:hypothetical protein
MFVQSTVTSIRDEVNNLIQKYSRTDPFTHEEGSNWFRFTGPDTTLQFHGEGLGDEMIIYQFGKEFADYISKNGDPNLGEIVISCGATPGSLHPDDGDVNLYWWYSFGSYDDQERPEEWFEHYLSEVTTVPDTILCTSSRIQKEASQHGFDTLYLPLASGSEFRPLNLERKGLGYAGTKGHKREEKEQKFIIPLEKHGEFEWVDSFHRASQLNLWYNTRLATVGVTKEAQRQWGVVNIRVFETLASGTPFILESHPTVESVLGFEFPYQTSSRDETIDLLHRIESDYDEILTEFEKFSEMVRKNHTYSERLDSLIEKLQ